MDLGNYAKKISKSRTKGTVNIQNPKKNNSEEANISINYLKVKQNAVQDTKEFILSYQEGSFKSVPNSHNQKEKKKKSSIFYRNCVIAFIITFIIIVLIVLVVILTRKFC